MTIRDLLLVAAIACGIAVIVAWHAVGPLAPGDAVEYLGAAIALLAAAELPWRR